MVKHHLLCAPLIQVFEDIDAGKAPPVKPIEINYRENESFFIKPEGDQCQVMFSMNFVDPDDQIYAKVFLQEFEGARRVLKQAHST
eukprot:GABW01001762.1.p1 GENE.GABW01001762.1~~GABW01001762.1.p1  ORF type:complete len:86 (-),score=37.50 GABW01001762.1:3-260(-)